MDLETLRLQALWGTKSRVKIFSCGGRALAVE